MFDKISRAAERAAAGVSRRNFLGRLGVYALGAASFLGGVTALAGPFRVRCCKYTCAPKTGSTRYYAFVGCTHYASCPPTASSYSCTGYLVKDVPRKNCYECSKI
jgi:hypothetical protein